jgi:hypothetical protein
MSLPRPSLVRALGAALGAAVIFVPCGVARAADDVGAEAEALFRAGKKLMDEGDYAAACPKLAESQRLDPGNGTLARLATCHEKQGKLATAWSEFAELLTSAQRANQADREKFARQHVAALQPQLSRLTIHVPAAVAALPGIVVRRDGVAIGQAVWGVAVPLDPGDHLLEAEANDRVPWSAHVTIGAVSDAKDVTVPALDPVPAAPPAPVAAAAPVAAPPQPHSSWGTQRTIGVVVAAAGVVGLGIGSYFGVRAISDASQANSACPNAACSSAGAVSQSGDAKTNAHVADVLVPVGAAGLVAGAILYFLAPSAPGGPRPHGVRRTRRVELVTGSLTEPSHRSGVRATSRSRSSRASGLCCGGPCRRAPP